MLCASDLVFWNFVRQADFPPGETVIGIPLNPGSSVSVSGRYRSLTRFTRTSMSGDPTVWFPGSAATT